MIGFGRAGSIQFPRQSLDFAAMILTRRTPLAHAEQQIAAGQFGEFNAANPQTGATVVALNLLHAWQRGEGVPIAAEVRSCAAAGLEARIHVALIAWVHTNHVVLSGVAEQLESRRAFV